MISTTLSLDLFTIARLGKDGIYMMIEEQLNRAGYGISVKHVLCTPIKIEGCLVLYKFDVLRYTVNKNV